MSAVSLDFRNVIASRKCAIPSPEIVSLEIGDESPGNKTDSGFSTFFLSGHGSENGFSNNDYNTNGCGNRIDKDFLIHPQLTLSSSRDNSYSNQESRVGECDIDDDLLELLNSAKSTKTVEPSSRKFHGKSVPSCANEKMKTLNNLEAGCDDSDLLSSLLLPDAVPPKNGFNKLPSFCCDTKTDVGDFDILSLNVVGRNPSKFNNKDITLSQDSAFKDISSLSDLLSSVNIQNSNRDAFTKSRLNYEHGVNSSEFNVKDSLSDLLSSIVVENTDANKLTTSMCCDEFGLKSSDDSKFKIEGSLSDLLLSVNTKNSNCMKPNCIDEENLKSLTFKAEGSFLDFLPPDPNEKISAKSELVTRLSNNSTAIGESRLSDLSSANDVDWNVSKSAVFNPSDSSVKSPTCRVEDCVSDWLSMINVENSFELSSNALSKFTPSTADVNSSLKNISDSSDLDTDSTSEATYSSSNDSCASSFNDAENNSLQVSLTKNGVRTDSDDSGFNSFDSQKSEFSFFSSSPESLISLNLLLSEGPDRSKDKNKRNEIAEKEMSMLDLVNTINLNFKHPISESSDAGKIYALNCCDDPSDTNVSCVTGVDLMNSFNSQGLLSGNLRNRSTEFARNDYNAPIMTSFPETTIPIPKELILCNNNDFFSDEDKSVGDTEEQCIDLSSCIKSTESKLNSVLSSKGPEKGVIQATLSPVENHVLDESLPLYIPQNHLNPFECSDADPVKKSQVNTKQSLFSKALACKPRRNSSLAKKVVSIKCELYQNIINRPVLLGSDVPPSETEVVSYSDRCILPFQGRKYFGIDAPSEPQ